MGIDGRGPRERNIFYRAEGHVQKNKRGPYICSIVGEEHEELGVWHRPCFDEGEGTAELGRFANEKGFRRAYYGISEKALKAIGQVVEGSSLTDQGAILRAADSIALTKDARPNS